MNYAKLAEQIARKAHEGQWRRPNRKDGNYRFPYIHHPAMVARRFNDDIHKSIAWLHDVFEMSNISNIILLKFPNEVLEAVMLLTKKKEQNYYEYIYNLKKNRYAKAVKIQDILHNYKTATKKQKQKYDAALKILKEK